MEPDPSSAPFVGAVLAFVLAFVITVYKLTDRYLAALFAQFPSDSEDL